MTPNTGSASADLTDCVDSGRHTNMVDGLAGAAKINASPTVRINGLDYQLSTPEALMGKITENLGR